MEDLTHILLGYVVRTLSRSLRSWEGKGPLVPRKANSWASSKWVMTSWRQAVQLSLALQWWRPKRRRSTWNNVSLGFRLVLMCRLKSMENIGGFFLSPKYFSWWNQVSWLQSKHPPSLNQSKCRHKESCHASGNLPCTLELSLLSVCGLITCLSLAIQPNDNFSPEGGSFCSDHKY